MSVGGPIGGSWTRESAAVAVCRALNVEFAIDAEMDSALPNLDTLLSDVHGSRSKVSELRAVERALLCTLLSRNVTASESFANVYVHNMVRAGEAIGHERMCDMIQSYEGENIDGSNLAMECGISTLLPYDIIVDDQGWWQDPGRFEGGFTPGLTAQELLRRAHARAQIQRSLFKIQEKHGIKGGAKSAGVYGEPAASTAQAPISPAARGVKRKFLLAQEVNQSNSFSHPPHYSAPLVIDTDDIENTPYGRYESKSSSRGRSLSRTSFSSGKRPRGGGGGGASSSAASASPPHQQNVSSTSISTAAVAAASASLMTPTKDASLDQNPSSPWKYIHTRPIDWRDVVGQFQPVSLPGELQHQQHLGGEDCSGGGSSGSKGNKNDKGEQLVHIFAPVFRKLVGSEITGDNVEENAPQVEDGDSEEDISDNAVLARHQEVLDLMKKKLDVVMEEQSNRRPCGAVGSTARVH